MTRHFKVVIQKEIKGGYSAFIPSLPGCTTQGETLKETVHNIKEALELYLESLKDDGLSLPALNPDILIRDIKISV